MPAVLDALNAPWAITPEFLQQMHGIYGSWLRGEAKTAAELSAALGRDVDNQHRDYEVDQGVAIIPVHGVMAKRMNMFQAISGGSSTQLLMRDLQQALDDSSVHSILLDFDTPGGAVDGLPQFADAIRAAAQQKTVVSLASGLMASAGVWAGTASGEVYAADVATQIGSIGVVATHVDYSGREKQMGVKTTEIYAGKYKRIDTAYEPLSEEGRATIQAQVDYLYGLFVDAVASHRNTSVQNVLANMADARMFVGQQAVDAGLVDGIKTREEIITMLVQRHNGAAGTSFIKSGGGRRSAAAAAAPTARKQEATMPKPTHKASEPTQKPEDELLEDEQQEQPEEAPAEQPEETPEETPESEPEQTPAEGPEEENAEDDEEDQKQVAAFARKNPAMAAALKRMGAAAERSRIQGVLAQAMPGFESLVNSMAFDGKTQPGDAAMAVTAALRKKTAQAGADLSADAPAPVITPATSAGKPSGSNADAKAMAAEAQALVDAAEAKGDRMSYAQAMAIVKKNHQ